MQCSKRRQALRAPSGAAGIRLYQPLRQAPLEAMRRLLGALLALVLAHAPAHAVKRFDCTGGASNVNQDGLLLVEGGQPGSGTVCTFNISFGPEGLWPSVLFTGIDGDPGLSWAGATVARTGPSCIYFGVLLRLTHLACGRGAIVGSLKNE